MRRIEIGSSIIGEGKPCFVVAEIGINHNGSLELARETIDAAVAAGADAVKFQHYRTEDFISDRSLTLAYESQGTPVVESQYDLFKRCELDFASLRELKAYGDRRGAVFHSTPTSAEGVRELVEIGVPVLKNGSDFLTNLALVRTMARTGLPTVLSTGMATLAEIDDAVRAFRDEGSAPLLLLHCVSSYPTPAEEVHLRRIPVLGAAFDCLVGFSDHTWGNVAAVGSVALGACWIEKHFTLDKGLPGPDHRFSADPAEFRALVESVRTVEKNLGAAAIVPTPSEAIGRRDYRLSCVAARDLVAGHRLAESDIAFRRPGLGLPPKAADWLVGRRLGRDLQAGRVLLPADFA